MRPASADPFGAAVRLPCVSAISGLAPSLPVADNLLAARELMAFTLGFHIILACVGVALPAMMLIAEFKGRRNDDEIALDLAKRWSKAAAVLFAVGAVTGTVLSFEMGLLWPRFMERFGDVFGTGFAIEGIFFFTEAIFIAIYIYGWKRIEGWKHFWTGVPIFIAGIGGAFSVVAVNSWMNQPQGFKLDSAGNPIDVEPLNALFNPATAYEFPHMLLAAYMVVGFGLASVYAVAMLRNPEKRRDRRHRLGLLIPLTVAAILTPVQLFVGDIAARGVADHQPSKFAGFECIQETGPNQTEWLGGICTDDGVEYGIGIPGLDSFLVGFSTDTVVTGLDQIPTTSSRPPTRCSTSPSTRWSGSASRCWRSAPGSVSAGGASATSRRRSGSFGRSLSAASARSSRWKRAGSSPRSAGSRGSSTR